MILLCKNDMTYKMTYKHRVEKFTDIVPDTANIDNLKPYHLLGDKLPDISHIPEVIGNTTIQECHCNDLQTKMEHVGNYRQCTNNYKREYPDSCSALLREFTGVFYKPILK